MSQQPIIKNGFYLHYKNKVYKLMDFAEMDDEKGKKFAIYQPQYETEGFPEFLFWARPKQMFFENIKLDGKKIPRFDYLSKSEYGVLELLKERGIKQAPRFNEQNMLSGGISELVFNQYAIHGFAKHSETLETQIIYMKNGLFRLLMLPEKQFFEQSGINPEEKNIVKYLSQIKDIRE